MYSVARLTLLSVVMLIAVLFVAAGVMATEEKIPMVDDQGIVRVVEKVRPLNSWEQESYDNPGKEIPGGMKSTQWERVDFFHGHTTITYTQVMVYQDGKFTVTDKVTEVIGEVKLAAHVVFLAMAIALLLMAFANVLYGSFDNAVFFTGYAVSTAYAGVVIAFFTEVAPLTIVAALVATGLIVAALVATGFCFNALNKKWQYWIASAIFCIAIIMAMII